jgi:magnesium-transporting ATPase (P-type)
MHGGLSVAIRYRICARFDTVWRQEGEGLMVVLAVGVNTYQGKMEEKMKEDEDEKSVLQRKLDDMTNLITKVGPRPRPLLSE